MFKNLGNLEGLLITLSHTNQLNSKYEIFCKKRLNNYKIFEKNIVNINEYNHLYNIIFSKATLQSYSIRPQMTSNLISRLTDLKKWARDTNTPLSDICVVGGAVLDLYGYKLCDDIDIVIKQSIRDERNYGSSPKLLTDGIDIVKSNYSRKALCGWRAQ